MQYATDNLLFLSVFFSFFVFELPRGQKIRKHSRQNAVLSFAGNRAAVSIRDWAGVSYLPGNSRCFVFFLQVNIKTRRHKTGEGSQAAIFETAAVCFTVAQPVWVGTGCGRWDLFRKQFAGTVGSWASAGQGVLTERTVSAPPRRHPSCA